jgi:hypothetical protein
VACLFTAADDPLRVTPAGAYDVRRDGGGDGTAGHAAHVDVGGADIVQALMVRRIDWDGVIVLQRCVPPDVHRDWMMDARWWCARRATT